MANTSVKIPEKHYVTLQARKSECPVGFLVPWGTDKAAQRRMDTADNWATGRGWGVKTNVKLEAKIINNDLMSGFKLATDALRYGTSTVSWRVVDPRGFELEINSDNMMRLVKLTTIENGEILSRCVWARQGANNVLLPEEAQEYQDALKNTERVKTKISIRDVNIGDKVLMQNGEALVYLGKFFTLSQDWGDGDRGGEGIKFSDKKRHYFYADKIDNGYKSGPSFKSVSTVKISKIVETDCMDIKDGAAFINDKVQAMEAQVVSLSNNYEYRFLGVTCSLVSHSDITTVLEPIDDVSVFSDNINDKERLNGINISSISYLAKIDDKFVRISNERFHNSHRGKKYAGTPIHIDSLLNDTQFESIKEHSIHRGYSDNYEQAMQIQFNAQEVEDWFLPKIKVTDPKTGVSTKLRML